METRKSELFESFRMTLQSFLVAVVVLICVVSVSAGVFGCGFRAPLSAEEYNPERYSDHQIDLTPVEPIRDLYQMMKDTHEVFDRCGLPYWADSGTLLGAIRNQGIIPWDDDNDTAISSSDVPQFLILRPLFADLGYFIEKVFFGYRITQESTSAQLDIFVMNEVNGKFYYDQGDWGIRETTDTHTNQRKTDRVYITRDELFPLREVSFGPVRVKVPYDPKPYLDAMFRGWNDVAFTYGHAGQRKFKVDLNRYSQFRLAAPLDPNTFQTIPVQGLMKDRVPLDLRCPVLERGRHYLSFPIFFDGI